MKWPLVWRGSFDEVKRSRDYYKHMSEVDSNACAAAQVELATANVAKADAERRAHVAEVENRQLMGAAHADLADQPNEQGITSITTRSALRRSDNQQATEAKYRQLKQNFQAFRSDFYALAKDMLRLCRRGRKNITQANLDAMAERLASFTTYGEDPAGQYDELVGLLDSVRARLLASKSEWAAREAVRITETLSKWET